MKDYEQEAFDRVARELWLLAALCDGLRAKQLGDRVRETAKYAHLITCTIAHEARKKAQAKAGCG